MTAKLRSLLACPQCHGALADGAREAQLTCAACGSSHAIRDGIPVFVNLDRLPPHEQRQVAYFERERGMSDTAYRLTPWQERYVSRFLATFPDIAGKTVIDCGAGSGYMTVELTKRGAYVIACDLTYRSIRHLRTIASAFQFSHAVDVVCCSAEALPLRSGCADYVIESALLEHLPGEARAIAEIHRVCAPRAGLMLTVPLRYHYLPRFLLLVNLLHDRRIGHLRRYDEGDLRQRFPGWFMANVAYTGYARKVLKVLVNHALPVFDEQAIEVEDAAHPQSPWGASNISVLLRR